MLRKRSLKFWIPIVTLTVLFGPGIYDAFRGRSIVDGPIPKSKLAEAQIIAIQEALEVYKALNGIYPRPVGGSRDPIVQAKMLYQALTGDGTDQIEGAPLIPSDGKPGTDGELLLEAAFAGSRKSSFVHEEFYLADPWHHPYNYMRGDESSETFNKTTFDIWTEGTGRSADKDTWISNW